MRKIILAIGVLNCWLTACFADTASLQTDEIRASCEIAIECEKQLSSLESQMKQLELQEKTEIPIVREIHEVLTRCFTVLFDIQRFSKLLAMQTNQDKNDFVRCSVVIKNFVEYFHKIRGEFKKSGNNLTKVRMNKVECQNKMEAATKKRAEHMEKIEKATAEISKKRVENIIQNDVVYHIAGKSESIEELDAELEAENTIGVLRNTKIATKLKIMYPAFGNIVHEFGDKGQDGEMIHYLAFAVRPGAIVVSPSNGVVVFAGRFLNYGNMLIISNGQYRIFLYGMEKMFTATGDVISAGDYVGTMPVSKNGDELLLKLELKKTGEPLDPRHWIMKSEEKKSRK